MRIEKAIEILVHEEDPLRVFQLKDRRQAWKLGIKALERIQGLRSAGRYIGMPILKGETKE